MPGIAPAAVIMPDTTPALPASAAVMPDSDRASHAMAAPDFPARPENPPRGYKQL